MSLTLVPLSGRHVRELRSLIAAGAAPPAAVDGRAFVERAQRLRARRLRETLAICGDGRLLGVGVLTRDHAAPGDAELGYWIAPPFRGRGHATAAAARLVAHGFERMRLTRVVARSPTANHASIRVLEKAGLRFAGLEPAADASGPVRRYELSRAEWRPRP